MKKIYCSLLVVVVILISANLIALETGSRLLIFGDIKINEIFYLEATLIPSPNLNSGFFPLGYLGLGLNVNNHFSAVAGLGMDFINKEAIPYLQLWLGNDSFYSWIDLEIQPQSWFGLGIVKAEYVLMKSIHVGLELETKGSLTNLASLYFSTGPNILLKMGQVSVDFTVRAMKTFGEAQEFVPEIFMRVSLFL